MTPEPPLVQLPPPPDGYEQRMPRFPEATELVPVGVDVFGREQRLAPETAAAWAAMREAAAGEGVPLLRVSAFRSVGRQREIVARKLARGLSLEEIMRVNAYPGHSEHHTGRAVDIGSPACEHLTEAFETTPEYGWLTARARQFGFTLSYPRERATGVVYEPWHWCWAPGGTAAGPCD